MKLLSKNLVISVLLALALTPALALSQHGSSQHRSNQGNSKQSSKKSKNNASKFQWRKLEPGLSLGTYDLGSSISVLKSQVLLLKVSLRNFDLRIAQASDLGRDSAEIKSLTKHHRGVLGINTSFFDTEGKPLGLIVDHRGELNRLHAGGRLLTGIFQLRGSRPQIVHRSQLDARSTRAKKTRLAFQSGPRLIESGKPLKLSSPHIASRRSGIAIDQRNSLILYATKVRFPGASLAAIQKMLLEPELDVRDALNLDGGGSSQLYLAATGSQQNEILISGGDRVPVGLVVVRKAK